MFTVFMNGRGRQARAYMWASAAAMRMPSSHVSAARRGEVASHVWGVSHISSSDGVGLTFGVDAPPKGQGRGGGAEHSKQGIPVSGLGLASRDSRLSAHSARFAPNV